MKKILLLIGLLLITSNAYALNLSRVKTWTASEILTAADLNAEFNNILNHSLTNNDVDASAGIVCSKLDLSTSCIIGGTTPADGSFTTLSSSGIYQAGDKVSFTQTDNNEYIDSLADGFLDLEATSGVRFRTNGTERLILMDGTLQPTTDSAVDLGTSANEFGSAWFDETVNIDSLVADTADINGGSVDNITLGTNTAVSSAVITTADINGGTLDGVNIGTTTATGELIINNASDDAAGLGTQGGSGQFLTSAGTGSNPTWSTLWGLKSTTTIDATNSGNISISPDKLYFVQVKIIPDTGSSASNVYLRFNSDSSSTDYHWDYTKKGAGAASSSATGQNQIELIGSSDDLEWSSSRFISQFFINTNRDSYAGFGAFISGNTNWIQDTGGALSFGTIDGTWGQGSDVTDFEIVLDAAWTMEIKVWEAFSI